MITVIQALCSVQLVWTHFEERSLTVRINRSRTEHSKQARARGEEADTKPDRVSDDVLIMGR